MTPGTVIPSAMGVCQVTYNPRKYLTAAAKRRVLAAYGLPAGTVVVEWDHLVPRWAGGTSTSRNMWPILNDPDRDRKNRLGLRLYRAVCRGDARGVPPGVWARCDGRVDLECARVVTREFWRWW